MEQKVFFCKRCKGIYFGNSGVMQFCPTCAIEAIETDVTGDYWRSLAPYEKEALLECFVSGAKQGRINTDDFKNRIVEEAKLEAEEDIIKKKAMAEMLITSGFSFEGYRIVKYSGYISGDDAISVDRGIAVFRQDRAHTKDELMASLVTIRRNALRELKEAAYELGCNAVIGVDFDYLTLDPQTINLSGHTVYEPYVFGVTANGNAVVIEKIEE